MIKRQGKTLLAVPGIAMFFSAVKEKADFEDNIKPCALDHALPSLKQEPYMFSVSLYTFSQLVAPSQMILQCIPVSSGLIARQMYPVAKISRNALLLPEHLNMCG